jgi:hypothetical protein
MAILGIKSSLVKSTKQLKQLIPKAKFKLPLVSFVRGDIVGRTLWNAHLPRAFGNVPPKLRFRDIRHRRKLNFHVAEKHTIWTKIFFGQGARPVSVVRPTHAAGRVRQGGMPSDLDHFPVAAATPARWQCDYLLMRGSIVPLT